MFKWRFLKLFEWLWFLMVEDIFLLRKCVFINGLFYMLNLLKEVGNLRGWFKGFFCCCSVYVWVRVIFENDWVVGDNDWLDFVIKGK